MTNQKHTKGPWKLEDIDDPSSSSIYGADGKLVIGGEFDGYMVPFGPREKEEAIANAYLVSAAPELLEALQNIENDDGSIPETIWAMRNAAIKKAVGSL